MAGQLPVPILGAIISGSVAVVVALFGLAVKKWHFDVQSCLRVEIKAGGFKISTALQNKAKEPVQDFFSPMMQLLRAGGYMMVTITNVSRKKISGVNVSADLAVDMICQIGDAEEIVEMKKGHPIDIGDIQPKHSRVIHVWSNVDMSTFNFHPLRSLLRISADELDAVQFRFPVPRYLWAKYLTRLIWTFTALVWTCIVLFWTGFYPHFGR